MIIIIGSIIGLCIGSFLNVCIYRLPRQLSVCSPMRSFCPACQTQLSWWENIPLFSWLFLFAKCRHCRVRISGQYPLVEMLSGIAAAACLIRFGLTPTALVVYFLVAVLIAITFIDLEFKIIPNRISYPSIIIGCVLSIISQFTHAFSWPVTTGTADTALGMLAGWGFFHLIGLAYALITKREGLGGGDLKLMAVTGSILGIDSVVPIIFAGSIFGSVVGLLTILLRGGGRHTEIPFGPWLSLGAIVYIFANPPFLHILQ